MALNVLRGVSQGSVLGPIYINDLHNAIKYSSVYHFADDTNHGLFVHMDTTLRNFRLYSVPQEAYWER